MFKITGKKRTIINNRIFQIEEETRCNYCASVDWDILFKALDEGRQKEYKNLLSKLDEEK